MPFWKKAILTIGLLLMVTAGVMFAVFLLMILSSDNSLSRNVTKTGMILSAVVFVLASVMTAVSATFVWPEFKRNLKEKQKWQKRL